MGLLENINLVIFDMDGVIFDIVNAVRETVKRGIEKYKLNTNFQDAMQQVSHLLEIAQSLALPEMVLQSKELFDIPLFGDITVLQRLRIAASMYSDFRELKEQSGLVPNIDSVIKQLVEHGKKLVILSNNAKVNVEEVLKKFDLEQYFSDIIGFNEVSKTKPDPEGILKILEQEKIPSENTLFIGDMVSDCQAGAAANVKTIIISTGLVAKDKLVEARPFKLVENVEGLRSVLFN